MIFKDGRSFWLGLLVVILSGVIVLGSFTLGFVENGLQPGQPAASDRASRLATNTPPSYQLYPNGVATSTVFMPTLSVGGEVALIPTTTIPPIICTTPAGWMSIIVQVGDTLLDLAQRFGITPEELAKANCLLVNTLTPGTVLDVPNVQTAASAPPIQKAQHCGPPAGWTVYIVQPGDTLYALATYLGITVRQLQYANCLGSSTIIIAGQLLSVPFPIPPRLPSLTPTLPGYARPTATGMTASPSPTNPPTSTATASTTPTPPVATPTATPVPTVTPTPTAPIISPPTPTASPTPSMTALPTDTPTLLPSPTETRAPTNTPLPTATPTPTDTPTRRPRPTKPPTPTPTGST